MGWPMPCRLSYWLGESLKAKCLQPKESLSLLASHMDIRRTPAVSSPGSSFSSTLLQSTSSHLHIGPLLRQQRPFGFYFLSPCRVRLPPLGAVNRQPDQTSVTCLHGARRVREVHCVVVCATLPSLPAMICCIPQIGMGDPRIHCF